MPERYPWPGNRSDVHSTDPAPGLPLARSL
jgi:hypothetical protein